MLAQGSRRPGGTRRPAEDHSGLDRTRPREPRALRRATTSDPLLKNMVKALVEAQSSQLAGLRAAERFLETGDPENLNGPGGVLEAKTAAKKAIRSFQDEQIQVHAREQDDS